MTKTYLIIDILDRETQSIIKSHARYLFTDNVTAIISENNDTRVYFKDANPFSFIRIHLCMDDFNDLFKRSKHNGKEFASYHSFRVVKKEGSTFRYSCMIHD